MLVKVAPIGERVVEVNAPANSTIQAVLDMASVDVNGRSILLNNANANLDTVVSDENSIIALQVKAKGGK